MSFFDSLTRRQLFDGTKDSMLGLALTYLLSQESRAKGAEKVQSHGGIHHRPKAKKVIQLFMNGGVSQMDTFDYKPELIRRHGQKETFGLKTAVTSAPGALMKCPFEWKRHGECGRWVSSVFPHMAKQVDDLGFLMAMKSKTNVHGPASYLQNTGFLLPGFPCLGAWISFAMGTLNKNLPDFIVFPDQRGLPYNNAGNFTSGFLPKDHQGTVIYPDRKNPIPLLHPPAAVKEITRDSEREGLHLLNRLNKLHLKTTAPDSRLKSRMESFALAAQMQLHAPEAFDVSSESQATHEAYGLNKKTTQYFGRSCLLARRLIERGVRFVQVWSGAGSATGNWDNHGDIPKELPAIAGQVDQPISALLNDLKQRGLLEDTLVVWTTEFGRMPFTQGSVGRDHNGGTFLSWLAGAGIQGGTAHGESDPFSFKAQTGVTTGYDLNATILHLLGINHEKLTFNQGGVERRLTDVHGHVVHEILN